MSKSTEDLARELKRLWNTKVMVMPIIKLFFTVARTNLTAVEYNS